MIGIIFLLALFSPLTDCQTVTISQTSVSVVTGDVLNLTCNPASNTIGSYSFVWKRNGVDVFAGNFVKYFTSFPFGTNSTLVFNPPIQNLSGLYSCELSDTPSALATANVSIAPGCLPAPFRANAAVGEVINTSCSNVNPAFNPKGVITWKCVRDLTWDGNVGGCTFNSDGKVHLLAYTLQGSLEEVTGNSNAIQSAVGVLITIDGALHTAYIGRDKTYDHTLVVLTLSTSVGNVRSAFDTLRIRSLAAGFTLAGFPTSPYEPNSAVWKGYVYFRDNTFCQCPILWSTAVELKSDLSPVNLCLAPDYITTPCRCLDPLSAASCQCSAAFKFLSMSCTLDSDGDGITNYGSPSDTCEDCCLSEIEGGLEWPTTPQRMYYEKPCLEIHYHLRGQLRRFCDGDGKWRPIDYNGCTYTGGRTACVIIAQVTNSQVFSGSHLVQQFHNYFSIYHQEPTYLNFRGNQSNGETIIEALPPLEANSTLLSIFQRNGPPPGNYSFAETPHIICFKPSETGGCPCELQQEKVSNFKELCSHYFGHFYDQVCSCSLEDCQCRFPFEATSEPGTNRTRCEPKTLPVTSVDQTCSSQVTGSKNCSDESVTLPFWINGVEQWPETSSCDVYEQSCYYGYYYNSGSMKRKCDEHGMWQEIDYSQCDLYPSCQEGVTDVHKAISASVAVIEGARLNLSSTNYAVYDEVLDGWNVYYYYYYNYYSACQIGYALYPNDLTTEVEIMAKFIRIARATNYYAIPDLRNTRHAQSSSGKRIVRIFKMNNVAIHSKYYVYFFTLWREWTKETNGGGVISYFAAFEQLCVEFARVLPLDNTVNVSNVTGTNQDYLIAYSWSCGLDCGIGGNDIAVGTSVHLEFLPMTYQGERQYDVASSTVSLFLDELPQDSPVVIGYHQRLHWDAPYNVSSQGSWQIHNDTFLVRVGEECLNDVVFASIPFTIDSVFEAKCVYLSYDDGWVDTGVTTLLNDDEVLCISSLCGWHTVFYKYNLTVDPEEASAGLDLPIDCIIHGIYYHPPQIVWRVNGTDIGEIDSLKGAYNISSSVNSLSQETVYTLTFTQEQPGVYSCEYGNETSSSVSSNVNGIVAPTHTLSLTVHPSSTVPTGGELYLTCSIEVPGDVSDLRVVWKLEEFLISDYPEGTFVTASTGSTHTLHIVRPQASLSGVYTCEVLREHTVLNFTRHSVTIQPGCLPQIFLPATPLDTSVSLPCSTIHPSVRGTMEWTCVSDLTFDGHLGCYFENNANNSIALVTYVLTGSPSEIKTNQQRIKGDIDDHLSQILGNSLSSQIVEIRHLGYNLVEFALAVESPTIPSVVVFASLAANTNTGFTPGGYRSQPNLIGSPIMIPSNSCFCPIFYHDIQPQFTPGNPRLFGCRGPSYVRSPCRCDPGSYQLQACNCSGVYTANSTDSDGLEQCLLDTDGDGIPNSIDTCEGCCPEELSEGILWSSTLQGISDRRPCNLLHSSFNENTFVTRKCSNKGHWQPVDVSGCTFKESAELSVVVVVLSVRAEENEIRANESTFKNQVTAKYFLEFNISSITISMYASRQEKGETVVTCSLELPEDAVDSVINRYSTSRKKRDFEFLQEPVIYGFRPADECLCQDPNNIANSTSLTNICKGTSLSPCLCDDTGCQCLFPFVNVTSDSGPLKCSLDTDGDGLPDHVDPDPHVFDTSQLQQMEGCHAEEGVVCQEESTTSPNIDWYQIGGCYEAVAMCSTELANIIGQARRFCDSTGQWMEPDVSQCQSVAVREAGILIDRALSAITNSAIVQEGGILQLSNIETIQTLDAVSESLLNTTGNQQETLLPRDLSSTIGYLNSFATLTETTTLLTSGNFNAMNLFGVTSNILNEQNTDTWSTITNETSNVGTDLLNATERLSFSYATNAGTTNSPMMVRLDNLVVDARVVSSGSTEDVTITRGDNSQSSVYIPRVVISEEEADKAVVVVFIDRLSEYLPRRLSNQMAFNTSTNLSNIISIQVGRGQRLFENQSLVELTFTDITGDPICVFWEYSPSEDSNMSGGWSTEGVNNSSVPGAPGTVVCQTSHLTNFAILVSPASLPPESSVYKSLQVISYIGCIISLLCLLATIIFLISLRKELFTKLNQFVHLNLCIALACGLLVFMVGAQTAKDVPVLCVIIACLLHYFFLATFFWTLCEAVVMYNLLVRVFFANSRKWIFLYLPLGWGSPLPIVIISVAIRHDYYIISSHGQTVACWLSWDMGTIAAFIVPMCLVLLVNAILTVFIMRSLYRFYRGVSGEYHVQNDDTKAKVLVKKLMKAFVFILPLLDGAAIFVFYVLRHDKVRPKISALFTRCKRIKPYLMARRSALSRIPPMESMEVLSPGTPTTTRATFSERTSKLATVSMSYKDSMESEADDDEVQEAVLSFDPGEERHEVPTVSFDTTEEGRKVSTISFTLHERDDVVSSASTHVRQ